jgi:hypothetical protein
MLELEKPFLTRYMLKMLKQYAFLSLHISDGLPTFTQEGNK